MGGARERKQIMQFRCDRSYVTNLCEDKLTR
jgi:hypothetical protein